MNNNLDQTIRFNLNINRESLTKSILTDVYSVLQGRDYGPINQLVRYPVSGNPPYITDYSGARALLRKLEGDEILEEVIEPYLEVK